MQNNRKYFKTVKMKLINQQKQSFMKFIKQQKQSFKQRQQQLSMQSRPQSQ